MAAATASKPLTIVLSRAARYEEKGAMCDNTVQYRDDDMTCDKKIK